jgi:hypothetical protein
VRESQLMIAAEQVNFWTNLADGQAAGSIYTFNGTVSDVRMRLGLPVGRFIETLGTPTCVSIQAIALPQRTGTLSLYWQRGESALNVDVETDETGRWQPASLTRSVWIDQTNRACFQRQAVPWMGFAMMPRYLAAYREGINFQ